MYSDERYIYIYIYFYISLHCALSGYFHDTLGPLRVAHYCHLKPRSSRGERISIRKQLGVNESGSECNPSFTLDLHVCNPYRCTCFCFAWNYKKKQKKKRGAHPRSELTSFTRSSVTSARRVVERLILQKKFNNKEGLLGLLCVFTAASRDLIILRVFFLRAHVGIATLYLTTFPSTVGRLLVWRFFSDWLLFPFPPPPNRCSSPSSSLQIASTRVESIRHHHADISL